MNNFWKDKNILITGHHGFKGRWLWNWLTLKGAILTGMDMERNMVNYDNFNHLQINFDVVFHFAAQSMVYKAYQDPEYTFSNNIDCTLGLMKYLTKYPPKVLVVTTTDKVYAESKQPRKETSRLGACDPYSTSKACVELVLDSYRQFLKFPIVSVRSGNVIAGGDYRETSVVKDVLKNMQELDVVPVRNLHQTRPFYHVLDCLNGYMTVAEKTYKDKSFAGHWNFGPTRSSSVGSLIREMQKHQAFKIKKVKGTFKEMNTLILDPRKSMTKLKWKPKYSFKMTVAKIMEFQQLDGEPNERMVQQIKDYENI